MTLRVGDFAAVTDTGRLRRANEDAYYARAPLFGVADGMGGAQAGEVASSIAAEALARGVDDALGPEQRLVQVVREANRRIHERSLSSPDLQGMGTTMTVLLLGDDEVTIAHVGDSRAYRLREGELTQLTRDHSMVGEMVRRGALTPEEAEHHPQRSILTRALGPDADVDVDVHTHGAREGDVYLVCSDGLTSMVGDDSIREALAAGGSLHDIASELVRRANLNGGADNITVVLLRLTGAGVTEATDERELEAGAETAIATAAATPAAERTTSEFAGVASGASAGGATEVRPAQPAAAVRDQARARNRRSRRVVSAVLIVGVLLIAAAGASLAALQVYFIGVDDRGLLTVYRGLPYEGPVGFNLYTVEYMSTEPASRLTVAQRQRLLDHRLRNRDDALDLIHEVEQGRVAIDGEQR
jgi:protein phosphatase